MRKDAGDDPDVTDGLEVRVTLSWDDAAEATFVAGEGVGTVTKPGLQVPPGEPAINPVPRQMILDAIRDVTPRGVRVEISVPGGREIAAKTFNPRLGIVGGLSILGTTGIVRPYCTRALHDALRCTLDVAAACQVTAPVLVPGNVGARAARRHFSLRDEQLIEVGNAWGFIVDLLAQRAFSAVLLAGHPGKLAKLAAGQWDTHSARSSQATLYLGRLCPEVLGASRVGKHHCRGPFCGSTAAGEEDVGRRVGRAGARGRGQPNGQPAARGRVPRQHGRGMSRNRRRLRAMAVNPAKLWIVGCGPGSVRYVTDAAHEAAAGADVLVGGKRLLALFPDGSAERISVGANIGAVMEQIVARRAAGQRVVVLVGGDPGLHSLAQNVIRLVGRPCCEVVPAVSSVQVAFARLGMDWSDARILSAHGRIPADYGRMSWPRPTRSPSWPAHRKLYAGRRRRPPRFRRATRLFLAKTSPWTTNDSSRFRPSNWPQATPRRYRSCS